MVISSVAVTQLNAVPVVHHAALEAVVPLALHVFTKEQAMRHVARPVTLQLVELPSRYELSLL